MSLLLTKVPVDVTVTIWLNCLKSVQKYIFCSNSSSQNTLFSNNVSYQWIDKNNGVKIIFAHSQLTRPTDPTTELGFIVQDLKRGKNLKNLLAHTIITANSSGLEWVFKFNNLRAPNGYFSLKYLFSYYGTYRVITAIRSNIFAIALASFQIEIPLQSLNSPVISALPTWIAITIVGIVIFASVIAKIKRP